MSADVDIAEIPTDEASLRVWYDVMTASEAERPLFLWPSVETALRVWSTERPDREEYFFLARRAGDTREAVGAMRIDLSLTENQHLAQLMLFVTPSARRAGVGSALLAHAEAFALGAGRTTVLTDARAEPGDASAASASFAAARGYHVAGRMQLKLVDLPATADRWPGLEAHAAERLDGHRLVSWLDVTPEEHVDSMLHLLTRFLAEIPLEDVDLEPEVWDRTRLQEGEERRARLGVRYLAVAAQAPDGALVGFTDVRINPGADFSEIGGTLVLPEHRGHRLGLAMKVLLHRRQHELFPHLPVIVTGNAGVNTQMNAVNQTLGYAVVEDLLEMQKVLRRARNGAGSVTPSTDEGLR